MSDFHQAMDPDQLDDRHKGDWCPEDELAPTDEGDDDDQE
jgi:hypothetical protein